MFNVLKYCLYKRERAKFPSYKAHCHARLDDVFFFYHQISTQQMYNILYEGFLVYTTALAEVVCV